MGNYRTFGGKIIQASGADNLGADLYSEIVKLGDCTKLSLDFQLANTDAVGELFVLETNDPTLDWADWNVVEWDDGTDSIAVSSGTDVNQVKHLETFAGYLAVFYDYTSGDGQLDVILTMKRG